jgi:hypothetical protein
MFHRTTYQAAQAPIANSARDNHLDIDHIELGITGARQY